MKKKCLLIPLLISSLVACNGGGLTGSSSTAPVTYDPAGDPHNNPNVTPTPAPTSSPNTTPTPTPTPTGTPLPTLAHLYIANFHSNSVSQCNINESGVDETSCNTLTPTGNGALNFPVGVAVDSNNHLLISNFSNNGITQCDLDSSGNIVVSSCSTSQQISAGLNPEGMTIYNGSLYIANNYSSNDLALSCSLVPTGVNIGSCMTLVSNNVGGSIRVEDITFDSFHVYLTNYQYGYVKCNLTAGGSIDLTTCLQEVPGVNANISVPRGVAINNGLIYLVNSGNNSVTQCPVNADGVDTQNCTNVQSNILFSAPIGISIYNNYAYITNELNGSITQCAINSSGLESASCINKAPAGMGALNYPWFSAIH